MQCSGPIKPVSGVGFCYKRTSRKKSAVIGGFKPGWRPEGLKADMKSHSLKWSIFVFYSIFGLLPLVAISYLTLFSYTRSISDLTDKHVNQLIQRVGTQMDNRCNTLFNYLELLAKTPFVQLGFLQYPQGGQGSTVRDKLEMFRQNSQAFDRLTLVSNQGKVVAFAPEGGALPEKMHRREVLALEGMEPRHAVLLDEKLGRLLVFKTVFDYYKPKRAVGLVSGQADLDRLLSLVKGLQLGEGVVKTIRDGEGKVFFQQGTPGVRITGPMRDYSARMPLLGWSIEVRIPERVLYRDVRQVRGRTMFITFFVVLVAVAAVLAYSRRATKPLEDIIAGTQEFAAGNTDHRIPLPRGEETRRVAEAFNTMAKELTARQNELAQAAKLASLGLLSAGFAHEVRNPLAGIKTSAQVLERRGKNPQERNLARGISKEVDRLNQIVEDLLHFSRPKEPRRVQCDLAEIVESGLGLLEARFRQRRVQVENLTDPVMIAADPDQMIQVVMNLLLNAQQAVAPEKGVVILRSGLDFKRRPFLRVSDNGRGMGSEMIARIFDPFFSASKGGTGLGLSIVQTLLRQNGAGMEVTSQLGRGSTFIITFKRAEPAQSEVGHG